MQDGLRLELMKSPNISGDIVYKELCIAAKDEKHRLSESKKWQQKLTASPSVNKNPSQKMGANPTHNKPGESSNS